MRIRFGKEEAYLLIAFLAIGAYTEVVKHTPVIQNGFEAFWEWLKALGQTQGYLGGFVAAFLANFSILIPIPYTIVIFLIGATGANPLLLGIISGIGAGLGESSSYFLGYFGRYVTKAKYEKNVTLLRKIIEHKPKYIILLLFLIGATPIPDDIFIIPLGFIRYGFFRMIIPEIFGKIAITLILAYAGRWTHFSPALSGQGPNGVPVDLITLIGSALAVYAVLKVDWDRVGQKLLRNTEKAAEEVK